MKRKIILFLLTATVVTGLAGCSGSSSNEKTQTTTESTESTKTKEEKVTADDLLQEENKIFVEHKAVWDKVFAAMDKTGAQETDYVKLLKETVKSMGDKLDKEELKTVEEDIEKIAKIEEQIASLPAENSANESAKTQSADKFPAFKGTDLEGKEVDESVFAKNAVTLVNFWFNGCSPCVAELPALDKLNQSLKEKGGAVLGINTETLDGNQDAIALAKEILKKQGASYQNIYFDSNSEAGNFATSIMSFPTSILVDRNGKIIGEPIVGGLDNENVMKAVEKRINQIIENDKKN